MAKAIFTTPPGRLVQGSLYKPQEKDASGAPLVFKSGPNAGQPKKQYFFAVAVPKGAEQHWSQTPWGQAIWSSGHSFKPNAGQLPKFAWKIVDGDSTVPNDAGKKPCDMEGFKGHWVLRFSSGFAPGIYTLINVAEATSFPTPDGINLGDYIQVNGSVDGNGDQMKPGVYLNHNMACLVGYGQRIVTGPDVASAGFGGAPLPAGASTAPVGGFTAPPAVTAAPPTYVAPQAPAPAVAAAPVQPYGGFMQPPAVPVAPAAPVRTMTPAANGATFEQFIAAGWTEAQMRDSGMLV